jgi:hypothetical protein
VRSLHAYNLKEEYFMRGKKLEKIMEERDLPSQQAFLALNWSTAGTHCWSNDGCHRRRQHQNENRPSCKPLLLVQCWQPALDHFWYAVLDQCWQPALAEEYSSTNVMAMAKHC